MAESIPPLKRIAALDRSIFSSKEAGVNITPAGSTFPYGEDKEEAYLRIAPTYPGLEDLDKAMHFPFHQSHLLQNILPYMLLSL